MSEKSDTVDFKKSLAKTNQILHIRQNYQIQQIPHTHTIFVNLQPQDEAKAKYLGPGVPK